MFRTSNGRQLRPKTLWFAQTSGLIKVKKMSKTKGLWALGDQRDHDQPSVFGGFGEYRVPSPLLGFLGKTAHQLRNLNP